MFLETLRQDVHEKLTWRDLISKLKSWKVSSNFQNQLKEDIKAVKNLKELFNFLDKASNIYQIEKDEYNKSTVL